MVTHHAHYNHVSQTHPWCMHHYDHHHHLSLNHEGHQGNTDDFATSFLHFFPVLHCPLGLAKLQACPFPDAVFPPLPCMHTTTKKKKISSSFLLRSVCHLPTSAFYPGFSPVVIGSVDCTEDLKIFVTSLNYLLHLLQIMAECSRPSRRTMPLGEPDL